MENKELLEKAKQANSAEELLALAKENNFELTQEQAVAYFEQMNKSGELSDDELDNVAGGCGGGDDRKFGCPNCGSHFIKLEFYAGDQTYFVCRECGYSGKESTWYN